MLRRSLYHLSSFLRCKSIRGNAEVPYMERYFLLDCFGTRVYLHRFLGGDAEEAVHDHPWKKAKALVLTGRYEELRTVIDPAQANGDAGGVREERFVRKAGGFNTILGATLHRIVRTEPETWTLFWHTRDKIKPWGFLKVKEDGSTEIAAHQSSHKANWEKFQPIGRNLPERAPYLPRNAVPPSLLIED